jgi:lysozyme
VNASQQCRDFIRGFESLRLTAYLPTPDDVWTIGWGHTGPDVYQGLDISEETADLLFRADIAKVEHAVIGLVKVPLTQAQFDALVSFTFNVGAGNLATSTLLKYLNAGHYDDAAAEFSRWNKQAGRVLGGLTARRNSEAAMYLA